ncbi:hybrid sensor histidine kinase/response regulator [Burkholderia ambifaria]|uniref:Sensory/regulatory protein RpfC n=1 Tax=Burkholderia ambifaria MEX-5 TaxID=396597 RepID=B1T6S3_9BURK|nr:hybrid sensor histidine kinase/response regulator [Burkholderia ambifaria]EDT40716.1 Hpt sensor hybrid histidine kinase [Burkholderia ambifaria MEX-5]
MTVVILIALTLELITTIRLHIVNERQAYQVDHSLIMSEIEASEASIRNGVISAELVWKERAVADSAMIARFRANGFKMLLQPVPTMRPHLIFGGPPSTIHDRELGHYLALAQQLARSSAIASLQRGTQLTGYYFSVDCALAALVPAPSLDDSNNALGLNNKTRTISLLREGLDEIVHETQPAIPTLLRPLRWLPPAINPVTGRTVVRLASPALSDGKPFVVLVTEYDLDSLTAPLAVDHYDGTFLVVSKEGKLITTASRHVSNQSLIDRVMQSHVASAFADGQRETYRDGVFTISDQLGNTGWLLVYAFSWHDIANGTRLQLASAAGTTGLVLIALWVFVILFDRRVFVPVLVRSRRVFESEQLSRTLIDTAPVGLGLIAIDTGEPLLRSPVMAETAKRVMVDAPTLSAELVRRHAQQPQTGVLRYDRIFALRDGGQIDLAVSSARARYRGTDVLVTAFTDVTEKNQLAHELRNAKQAAESANAAKSAFVAAMSHEIRTPLNAILGNLELLSLATLDAEQRNRLSTIRTSSDGLLAIISDILDFSKIEAGEMAFERIDFDCVELTGRALAMFAPGARAKGLRLYGQFDVDSALSMNSDPVRIGQIINNLLSNAVKFTSAGHVTLRLATEYAEDGATLLLMSVEDTGIGMTPEQQERLFSAFSQGDASIHRRFGGTGLGLALCKLLAQALGGSIHAESTPNVGSRFTVRLPTGSPTIARPDPAAFAGETILFLSADEAWHTFALPHLQSWGLNVLAYTRPAEIAADLVATAKALVIFGERDAWSLADENTLVEASACVIDGHSDGPIQPMHTGRVISLSCYSLTGLKAALWQALSGHPPGTANDDASVGSTTRQIHQRSRIVRRLRVLVAEDNPVNQSLFQEQLNRLDCEAVVLSDGEAALAALARGDWDVLLTDLGMPGIDGYELARAARNTKPSMPIIAVTAYATLEERERCASAGMTRVMLKPLSLAQLRDALIEVAGADDAAIAPLPDDRLTPFGGKQIPVHLRDTFITFCRASVAAIQAASDEGNSIQAIAELHSLTGALGVFGQRELAKRCVELEQRVKEVGVRESDVAVRTFMSDVRAIYEK